MDTVTQPLAVEWHAEQQSALGRRLASEVRDAEVVQENQEEEGNNENEVPSQPGVDSSPEKPQHVRMADWPEAWRLQYEAWSQESDPAKRRELWAQWERDLQDHAYDMAPPMWRPAMREWRAEDERMEVDARQAEEAEGEGRRKCTLLPSYLYATPNPEWERGTGTG